MTMDHQQRKQLADSLYERFGKPLEAEHRGEYVAVSPEGKVLLGPSLSDVARRALEAFGRGSFLFRLGTKSVGKWR